MRGQKTRQTAVPLFNQKKRNRLPLTSAPPENKFFSHSEFPANASHSSGDYRSYQASGPSSGGPPRLQWNRQDNQQSAPLQQYGGNRPAPGPSPVRNYACIPHPYKSGGTSSNMGQPCNPVRQQPASITSRNSQYRAPHSKANTQSKPSPHTGLSQRSQQSSYRPSNPSHQYSQQSRPPPALVPPPSRPHVGDPQPQKNSWKFTNSFGPQSLPFSGSRGTDRSQTVTQNKSQGAFPGKPTVENSLRILTEVIDGMKYWSQFKDRVPFLFEIFATLDSAVTLGHHGAKTFLMTEGKQVVQCVFYENEQELPRLIRGQVHRCVGNYDRSRDVLICVSVRPAFPSEQRNAQEAVKVCDAEMRGLVKYLCEV